MKQVRTERDISRAFDHQACMQSAHHICTGPDFQNRGRVVKIWGVQRPGDQWFVGVDFGCSKNSRQYTDLAQALSDVCNYLLGVRAEVGNWLTMHINQGDRDCYITEVKRTRCRLEYEMPNAGLKGGWYPMLDFFGEKVVQNWRPYFAGDHTNKNRSLSRN